MMICSFWWNLFLIHCTKLFVVPKKHCDDHFHLERLLLLWPSEWACFFFFFFRAHFFRGSICRGLNYLHTLPIPVIHRDMKVGLFAWKRCFVTRRNSMCRAKMFLLSGATKTKKLFAWNCAILAWPKQWPIQRWPTAWWALRVGWYGAPESHAEWIEPIAQQAPEVVNLLYSGKAVAYTEKADIWSLGMIIYEMVELRVPYSDVNQWDVKGDWVQFSVELTIASSLQLSFLVEICPLCATRILRLPFCPV